MIADLPRVDELSSLPFRSQVAFAARCAWRVRHLFKLTPAAFGQLMDQCRRIAAAVDRTL